MAARLEAATKQYNVPILLSEDFVTMLSPEVRRRVRQIDCVTVKGSRQPIGLYTYDVGTECVEPPSGEGFGEDLPAGHAGQKEASHVTYSEQAYGNEFGEHPDILAVTAGGDDFLARFSEGIYVLCVETQVSPFVYRLFFIYIFFEVAKYMYKPNCVFLCVCRI